MHFAKIAKWGLLLAGSLVWSLTMWQSGRIYGYGMGFWGPHGHDAVWHISLARSLASGSLQMPIFAGEQLKNYHLGYDLLLAGLYSLTALPLPWLYFQILPPLFAAGIGYLVYQLVFRWQRSSRAAWWSAFFVYFGGSWGWLVSLVRSGSTGGESMFWSQQAISTLINPPFALSVLLLLAGLLALLKRQFWPAVLVFAVVGWVKIYAGIIGFSGLLLWSISLWRQSRDTFSFRVFFMSVLLFLILFLPFNLNASGLLVWRPFWFLETLLGLSDRFNWPYLYEVIVTNNLAGNYLKTSLALIAAFGIFLVGNLGTRFLFIFIPSLKSHFSSLISVFLWQGIILGILFPLFFIQSGTPWNTIQFFYYSQLFLGILAGISVSQILKIYKFNIILNFVFCILIFLLTIPTTFDTLRHYLPSRPPAMIGSGELEALDFLSRQPDGVVLTVPFNRQTVPPPVPLYFYESTAYVSAFSGQPVWLEDQVNLDITGYPWRARRDQLDAFFRLSDSAAARQFLYTNNIRYLYLPNVAQVRPSLGVGELGMTTIFENSQVAIWSTESVK